MPEILAVSCEKVVALKFYGCCQYGVIFPSEMDGRIQRLDAVVNADELFQCFQSFFPRRAFGGDVSCGFFMGIEAGAELVVPGKVNQ